MTESILTGRCLCGGVRYRAGATLQDLEMVQFQIASVAGMAGCSFGRFAPPKPLDVRTARESGDASLADKAGPVRENIRGTRKPLWQVAEQIRPRLRLRRETRRNGGDMEQDWLNPFHHRESGEFWRIGAR